MKVRLTLQDEDLGLPDEALTTKAHDALCKALDRVQPGLGASMPAHEGQYEGRGGEVGRGGHRRGRRRPSFAHY